MKKWFYLCGLAAPLLYIFTVILGGALWPGYSHVRQPISELTMASAPNLGLMDALFAAYGILLFLHGFGLAASAKRNPPMRVSGLLMVLCALAGIAMVFFRQDPIGAPLTFTGTVHLILAGVTSLSTILVIFFGAAGFSRMDAPKALRPFSIACGILVLATGGLTAAGTALFPYIFGILERTTIGIFMLWLLVNNWSMLRHGSKKPAA